MAIEKVKKKYKQQNTNAEMFSSKKWQYTKKNYSDNIIYMTTVFTKITQIMHKQLHPVTCY
jgi:hypothetical protein